MNQHFEIVIGQLRLRRDAVDRLIVNLEKFAADEAAAEAVADLSQRAALAKAAKLAKAWAAKPRKPYKKRAGADGVTPVVKPSISALLEAPTSTGAAMKLEICGLNRPFTAAELRALCDTKHAAVMAASSPAGFMGNLTYWASHGKLKRAGEHYTVTEPAFFGME